MSTLPPRNRPQSARRPITQRDLARKLGVAQVSVSRALAGDPAVAPALRDRVLQAAGTLGYRRNASAKAMRTGRHGAVGLLLGADPQRSAVPSDLLWGLQEDLRAQGLRLTLGWLTDAEFSEPAVLAEWSVDGCLVFYTHDIPDGAQEQLAARMPACLWLNADLAKDCVLPDEIAASRELGARLAALGHRSVAFVGMGAGFTHYALAERRDGMRDHLTVTNVEAGDWGPTRSWIDAAEAWLKRARPTAVVAHEANCLLPVYAAALRLGLRIPQDLSLAVFTNRELGLPVTTMRVPSRELARRSVEGLLARISRPNAHQPAVRVPLIFQDYGSLAPPSTK